MQHRIEILRLDVLDHQLTARDGGEANERGDLDVVGADAMPRAAEAGAAVDAEDVRANAVDLRTHRDEKAAEVLHVRLARRVDQRGVALGEHRGHHGVLGGGHGRLVHEEAGAGQPVGRAQREVALDLDLGAERGEGVQVRVDAASADDVATRRRHEDLAAAGEQRAGQKDRGTDADAERAIDRRRDVAGGLDAQRVALHPLHVGAGGGDELRHHLDVADARHVLDHALVLGQQARSDDRERAVLVAADLDAARQRRAALDDEEVAERIAWSGGRHRPHGTRQPSGAAEPTPLPGRLRGRSEPAPRLRPYNPRP